MNIQYKGIKDYKRKRNIRIRKLFLQLKFIRDRYKRMIEEKKRIENGGVWEKYMETVTKNLSQK